VGASDVDTKRLARGPRSDGAPRVAVGRGSRAPLAHCV